MSSNKKSSTKKSLKLKKGGAFEYAKMFQSSLSPCDKKNMAVENNSQNGGSNTNPDTSIRLYDDYSKDWHYPGTPEQNIPYAIDSSAGINEYQFGRTTPDNHFIVATGLVKNNVGIEMTGGKKTKSKPSTTKKVVKKVKSTVKNVVKSVESVVKKVVKKVKSSTSKKSKPSKKVVKKPKSLKSKSMLNKTKNAIKSVGKKVSSLFTKK